MNSSKKIKNKDKRQNRLYNNSHKLNSYSIDIDNYHKLLKMQIIA